MSVLRPLPPRPNLEFEHKEAKALLRRLRAGDPDSLARARARHSAFDVEHIKLADAQLVIAREYGFTSWPRLVRYFEEVERLRHYPRERHGTAASYEGRAQAVIRDHRNRLAWTAAMLSAYVPRFYGMRDDEVFAQNLKEDDARLVTARMQGAPTWEALLERVGIGNEPWLERSPWREDPLPLAGAAIKAADLPELQRVCERYPELLAPTELGRSKGLSLIMWAVGNEQKVGREAMRPIVEWLQAQGADLQYELNMRLCGNPIMGKVENIQWLLDYGADPDWIAPNGIPVFEHALLRYWNGDVVDLIASRAHPRKALWIAAGLGDVDGVRRFIDRNGKPTADARKLRPDFDAVGPITSPQHPDPTDDEILTETLFVAILNQRTNVIDYLASRGCSMNGLIGGMSLVVHPLSRGWVSTVESLIRAGADLDMSGWQPGYAPRHLAREMFIQSPGDAMRRRMAELCGLDPERLLAEYDATRPKTGVSTSLQDALSFAGDDAFRLGQSSIGTENLLFGVLRTSGPQTYLFATVIGLSANRFHADFATRLSPGDAPERPKLPFDAAAQAVIELAVAAATERRREEVWGTHLLSALTASPEGPVAELLTRYGSSAQVLHERIEI
jgi:hypothetical protein